MNDIIILFLYEILYIYTFYLLIDQSSLNNKHDPDKIHLLGSES
jgi:hypothetical protein